MVMSNSKLHDFKDPPQENGLINRDGNNTNKLTSDSQPNVESSKATDNKTIPEQKSIQNQDSRFKEMKYSFSPEDELPKLTEELLSRASNPKNIGIISSGGLSNKIIKKFLDKYSNSFQEYNFKTTFKTFDHSIVATKPTRFSSEEHETTEEGETQETNSGQEHEIDAPPGTEGDADFEPPETDTDDMELEFEPDPGFELEVHPDEVRHQDEFEFGESTMSEHPSREFTEAPKEPVEPESEEKKPRHLTFRERAYQIFYELKKKLGFIKPKPSDTPKLEEAKLPPEEYMITDEIQHEEMFEFEGRIEGEVSPKDEKPIQKYTPGLEPQPRPEFGLGVKSDLEFEPSHGEGIKPIIEEESGSVIEVLENKDILFIFTCLDDEFDVENVLVMSELAKRKNILSIVIASLPRYFGNVEKVYAANKLLQRLRLIAEIVILIPYYETIDFKLIPRLVHELLEVIIKTGLINVDVADLKIVVKGGNVGIVTFGSGKHATRHKDALFEALDSKLLNIELAGVKKALLNVTGSKNITLAEVEGLADQIKNRIAPGARFILGTNIDPEMIDSLKIFLLLGVKPMQVMVNKYANE